MGVVLPVDGVVAADDVSHCEASEASECWLSLRGDKQDSGWYCLLNRSSRNGSPGGREAGDFIIQLKSVGSELLLGSFFFFFLFLFLFFLDFGGIASRLSSLWGTA